MAPAMSSFCMAAPLPPPPILCMRPGAGLTSQIAGAYSKTGGLGSALEPAATGPASQNTLCAPRNDLAAGTCQTRASYRPTSGFQTNMDSAAGCWRSGAAGKARDHRIKAGHPDGGGQCAGSVTSAARPMGPVAPNSSTRYGPPDMSQARVTPRAGGKGCQAALVRAAPEATSATPRRVTTRPRPMIQLSGSANSAQAQIMVIGGLR